MIAPLRKAIGYCTLPRGPRAIAHSGEEEEDSVNRMQSLWRRRRCSFTAAHLLHDSNRCSSVTPAINMASKHQTNFRARAQSQ